MKTTIKTICLLAFLNFATQTHAQTKEETIEWLNIKKTEVRNIYSVTVYNGSLEITSEQLYAYDNEGGSSKYTWNEIKEIRDDGGWIMIVFNNTYKGETCYIKFIINNDELRGKYIKALKHMATLKGAKLLNDDLF